MTEPAVDVEGLIARAAADLHLAGVATPMADARTIAEFCVELETPFETTFLDAVEQRRQRVPLARITGRQQFRGLTLRTAPEVFLTRHHAESVAEAVVIETQRLLNFVPQPLVVDLCTGSGAIALSIAAEAPTARVIAVDLSEVAVALARQNNAAQSHKLVSISQADATNERTLAEYDGLVDVVVANPPYIPPDGVPREQEVRDHDPVTALFGGGHDGLNTLRGMTGTAARLLRPGGLFVLEHADVQAVQVRNVLSDNGFFASITTGRDDAGHDRFVTGRRVGPVRFATGQADAQRG